MSQKKAGKAYFTKTRADGTASKSPTLMRKANEDESAFFKRMQALGYGNVEKQTHHWDGDHCELHAGTVEMCHQCKAHSSTHGGATSTSMNPVKRGGIRHGKKGLTSITFSLPAVFAEQLVLAPLGAIHIVVDVPKKRGATQGTSESIKSESPVKLEKVSSSETVPALAGEKSQVDTIGASGKEAPIPMPKASKVPSEAGKLKDSGNGGSSL